MFLIFKPLLTRLAARISKDGWKVCAVLLGILFIIGWLGFWLFEPASKGIASPVNYWWWFVVTITTIGYGDYFPVTLGGRIAAVLVIFGGLSSVGILIGQISLTLQAAKGKKMKGKLQHKEQGHAVILGYFPGRTERFVSELLLGGHDGESVIVCAHPEQVAEHPMAENHQVLFVRGALESEDVLTRACVSMADRVIIDGRDDNETLMLALAVQHYGTIAHVVAALSDIDRSRQLQMVNSGFEAIHRASVALIVDAAQDPGIGDVYNRLQSNADDDDASAYRVDAPAGWAGCTFGTLQAFFGQQLHATIVAVRSGGQTTDALDVNPDWSQLVSGPICVYYVANNRLQIPWAQIA